MQVRRRGSRGLRRDGTQRSAHRTGWGLGLAISHRGVEVSGGVLHVRNCPARYVFTDCLIAGTYNYARSLHVFIASVAVGKRN